MQILIVRDGGATKVPREVADLAEAQALAEQGHDVLMPGVEDGQWVAVPPRSAEAEAEAEAEEAPADPEA